jgi:pimeloyl-ACP methyl ester carboxylesterase
MLKQFTVDFPSNLYPFKSNYFENKGHKLHYVDQGDGEVMLMLHGNPTWSFYYRNLIKEFSLSKRVVVPDHIGCGFSDKPQDFTYRLQDHIDNVKALIDNLEVKSITLVVHDWGGAIGFGLATQFPGLVKKIIALNTAAYTIDYIPKRIAICKAPVIGEFLVRGLNGFAGPATFLTTVIPLEANVRKAYLYPYNNYKNRIAVSKFVEDIPLNPKHPSWNTLKNIEVKLKGFTTPVMFIWGGQDFCFNDRFYNKWKELLPKAEYHYFKDAGHYVIEDKLLDCISLIKEFIAK